MTCGCRCCLVISLLCSLGKALRMGGKWLLGAVGNCSVCIKTKMKALNFICEASNVFQQPEWSGHYLKWHSHYSSRDCVLLEC